MAQTRHHIPIHTAALDQLYALMRDGNVAMRVRLDCAISASRVEPLAQPGETPPPAVAFLRNIINYRYEGKAYRDDWRRKAGAALSYWERRAALAAIRYKVADIDEHQDAWRRILNGLLRRHLWAHGHWPGGKAVMFAANDPCEHPPYHPELALAALLSSRTVPRRRARAIDEPDLPVVTSPEQRIEVLRAIAHAMHQRLDKAKDKEKGGPQGLSQGETAQV